MGEVIDKVRVECEQSERLSISPLDYSLPQYGL